MDTAEKSAQLILPGFKENCSVSRGVEIGELLKIRKNAVLYIQPCVSERGKLIADVELKREEDKPRSIDPPTLCSILEIHKRRFGEFKCSRSLGVAKLRFKGKEISIFKSGKLKIQRVLDKEEILKTATSITRLIWGAVVCDICGYPTIACASGKCGKCISERTQQVTLEEIPNAAPLVEGYSALKKAEELGGKHPEAFQKAVNTAEYLALFFIEEAADKETARLGLILLGKAEQLKELAFKNVLSL